MNSTNTQQFDSVLSNVDTTPFVCDLTDFIEQNEQYHCLRNNWKTLSVALIHLLKEHPEKVTNWNYISTHFWALPILMAKPDKIPKNIWYNLSVQEWALPLLVANPDKIPEDNLGRKTGWYNLSIQEWALPLLMDNPDKIPHDSWEYLCKQEWALPLLMANSEKIIYGIWDYLSMQKWALPLLMNNPDKIPDISWYYISGQEWALPLLMTNPDKCFDVYERSGFSWKYLYDHECTHSALTTSPNIMLSTQQFQLDLLAFLDTKSTQIDSSMAISASTPTNASLTQRVSGRSIGSVVAEFTPISKHKERCSDTQDSTQRVSGRSIGSVVAEFTPISKHKERCSDTQGFTQQVYW